jgi:hypothetical protein
MVGHPLGPHVEPQGVQQEMLSGWVGEDRDMVTGVGQIDPLVKSSRPAVVMITVGDEDGPVIRGEKVQDRIDQFGRNTRMIEEVTGNEQCTGVERRPGRHHRYEARQSTLLHSLLPEMDVRGV